MAGGGTPPGHTAEGCRVSGSWDIYIQRVGGNPISLTADSLSDDTQPAFSPDSNWIAFRSDRDGGGIFMMGATGESVRRLTTSGYNPAWSPDSTKIVYASESFDTPLARGDRSTLSVVDVASGEIRSLASGDAVQPNWAPGGTRIAYWGLHEGSGQRDVWTIDAAGGDAKPVTQGIHVDWNPVWSPDGAYLYFVSDRAGNMNLWRVPIDQTTGETVGRPQQVTTDVSSWSDYLSISSDGKRIAYLSESRTGHVQKVTFDPETEAIVNQPVWVTRGSSQVRSCDPSPDSQWLACGMTGGQEDIFLLTSEGTDRRQVTNDRHKDRYPRWSPDGQRLAFFSDRSGSWEIWTVERDGSRLRQLTDTPGHSASHPVWSPDGRKMVYQFTDERQQFLIDPRQTAAESQSSELQPAVPIAEAWFSPWSWSPDGTRIAGMVYGPESTGAMGIYDTRDETLALLGGGELPVWLNDNRRLVYVSEGKIFLIDSATREGGELLSIAPETIDPTSLRVARDNTIYFTRTTSEADIWLLNLE